ncbi:MAG TPA: PH domain-containing protein [Candidatus Saccharimonadales bacterium]|nr:PH domain-containing protein [Candidatus Saccharimonadales bacterium]
MVTLQDVENQLKQIGFNFHAWGRGEVKELCKILADDETIKQCANGYYQGGFAMLVATDQRLLLVDRKPLFLTLEAIWYDKIGQIDYYHRMLNATISISSPNKELNFTSMNHARLRQILAFSQQKMIAAKDGDAPDEAERKAEASMETVKPRTKQSLWSFGGQELERQLSAPTDTPQFTEQQPAIDQQPTTTLPIPEFSRTPDKLKLYASARLPFSRRRYFVR